MGVELGEISVFGRWRGRGVRARARRRPIAMAGSRIRPPIRRGRRSGRCGAARHVGRAGAWKLGTVTTPALSPDGTTVAYAKDGQIYSYAVRAGEAGRTGRAGGEGRAGSTSLVKAWGTNGTPVCGRRMVRSSPFVSKPDRSLAHRRLTRCGTRRRDVFSRRGVGFTTRSPTWSPDGKRPSLSFVGRARRSASRRIRAPAASAIRMVPAVTTPLTALRGSAAGQRAGEAGAARASTAPGRISGRERSAWAVRVGVHRRLHRWRSSSPTSRPVEGRRVLAQPEERSELQRHLPRSSGAGADHVIFEAEPEEWTRWYTVSVPASPAIRVRPAASAPVIT